MNNYSLTFCNHTSRTFRNQVAQKVHHKSQNLSKSMAFANALKEMKIVVNLKGNMTENKEVEHPTTNLQ